MSVWYKDGVVNLTQNSDQVVGVGTLFMLNVTPGDIFTKTGAKIYEVLSVEDNTHLTLTAIYAESSATNSTYAIIQRPGDPLEADVLTKIQTLLTTWQQREEDMVEWMTGSATINGTGYVDLTTLAGTVVPVKTLQKIDADLASTAKAAAGAMVTGNTETGISVTYQAGDQTLDFELQYGGSGSTWGVATTVARADHTHSAYALTSHTHSAFTSTTAGWVPNPGGASGRVLKDDGTWGTVALDEQGINALSDVLISGAVNGHVLQYNGLTWVNRSLATAGIAATSHSHDPATVFVTGTVPFARLPTGTSGSTVAIGNHTHTSTGITDWTAAVQATAGAMVSGNTETGISVTYATGKLNFAVQYGGNGVATTVSRSDHTHTRAQITDLVDEDWGPIFYTELSSWVASSATGLSVLELTPGSVYQLRVNFAGTGTASTAARSDHTHTWASTSITDWAEAVQDTAGAMVTGNTETGITVTYDDATGKINYAVAYAGTGAANTAARSDHTHVGYATTGANTFTGDQTISGTTPITNWTETDTGKTFRARVNAGEWQLFETVLGSAAGLKFDGDSMTLNAVNVTSDRRQKRNVFEIENAVDIVDQLRGVSFDWISTGRPDYGVLAQEVQAVVPELVRSGSDGFLSVNYQGLVPFLIEAVKELSARVRELETR